VVSPDSVGVLDIDPSHANALTLTTCNPKYSAAERLIVQADLKLPPGTQPLAAANRDTGRTSSLADSGLSGESKSKVPTVVWGLLTAVLGVLWWLVFHRHPRWTNWLFGAIPFVAVLFVFYFYLERILPANY
jgi:hypothetical protein